jgi:hypothetical protein
MLGYDFALALLCAPTRTTVSGAANLPEIGPTGMKSDGALYQIGGLEIRLAV